ncbi:hypothetical protein AGLY_014386 [Aphis glycines]|uniref:Uncharacterized protein n=1 Tax=Aphis glycines TaxID=307491 RepID=A0A6G0T5L0_APHGL|nr:hypothetical protein AGLY_014386 [Aphis glycines]
MSTVHRILTLWVRQRNEITSEYFDMYKIDNRYGTQMNEWLNISMNTNVKSSTANNGHRLDNTIWKVFNRILVVIQNHSLIPHISSQLNKKITPETLNVLQSILYTRRRHDLNLSIKKKKKIIRLLLYKFNDIFAKIFQEPLACISVYNGLECLNWPDLREFGRIPEYNTLDPNRPYAFLYSFQKSKYLLNYKRKIANFLMEIYIKFKITASVSSSRCYR